MKTVRILLLVLLALVLPLRGALASAAYCAGGPVEFSQGASLTHGHSAAHGLGHDHTHHHGQAARNSDGDTAVAGASVDQCNLCTASCSATPFVSDAPAVAAPLKVADAVFPALLAPPPSHPSDGQERPPRSI